MTLDEIIKSWNEDADEFNQWGSLDCDEKINYVVETMTADFNFKEPRLVLICAFRYALGRGTYMPSTIVEEIKNNWSALTYHDRTQIKGDILHAITHKIAGDSCDVKTWRKLLDLKSDD